MEMEASETKGRPHDPGPCEVQQHDPSLALLALRSTDNCQ